MTTNAQAKTTEHMHDLSIEMNDGLWRLQQSNSLDNPVVIDLHPVQIRLLAEHAGLLAALPKPLNNLSASHERRLNALHERIEELYFDDGLNSEIIKYCGSGLEIVNHLRAIHEQAEELVTDTEDSEVSENGATDDIKQEHRAVNSTEQPDLHKTYQNVLEGDKNA